MDVSRLYSITDLPLQEAQLMKLVSKEKKKKYETMFMDLAERISEMSHCQRLKVGCVVVKDGNIISISWNGTAPNRPNCCEIDNKTTDEVLHAEENAILKLAKSNESSIDSTMYITHAPCLKCARMIYVAGIKEVIFKSIYRDSSGLDYLKELKVKVTQIV